MDCMVSCASIILYLLALCKYLQTSADICRYLHISADICKYLQISANISADICRYLQISANISADICTDIWSRQQILLHRDDILPRNQYEL